MPGVFKGAVKQGKFAVTFFSDFSNADSDLLVVSAAEIGGGNPQVARAVSSPGGQAKAALTVAAAGILEVWVTIGTESDSGRLVVERNGKELHNEPVTGSVRWVYSVEA